MEVWPHKVGGRAEILSRQWYRSHGECGMCSRSGSDQRSDIKFRNSVADCMLVTSCLACSLIYVEISGTFSSLSLPYFCLLISLSKLVVQMSDQVNNTGGGVHASYMCSMISMIDQSSCSRSYSDAFPLPLLCLTSMSAFVKFSSISPCLSIVFLRDSICSSSTY